MGSKEYNKSPWLNPKVEVRDSLTHGLGMFAVGSIDEGEVVAIWGGNYVDEKTAEKAKGDGMAVQQINDGIFEVFDYEKRHDDPTYNQNHSCDPNTWMSDDVTIVACKPITTGEELTLDYATFVIENDNRVLIQDCHCGSKLCRRMITTQDWKRKDLQEKYRNHFSPFLMKRIKGEM